jgi:hypothetical protein
MQKIEMRIDPETKESYQRAAIKARLTLSAWIKSMISIGSGINDRKGQKNLELAKTKRKDK